MRGWRVVGGYALGAIVWAAGVLIVVEPARESWPMIMRGTARGSFLLFLLSFVAPALGRGRWLRENAGFLFVTFAVSHVLHAAAITSLAVLTRGESLGGRIQPAHLGGLGVYAVILAIAVGYAVRGGREPEGRAGFVAQEIGLHLIWLTFSLAYLGNALDRPGLPPLPLVGLAALGLGLGARWVGRQRR